MGGLYNPIWVCRPVQQSRRAMAKSAPRPESLLAALPTELSQSLFAKARPLSLAAHRTLSVAGGEGDGGYRLGGGVAKAGGPRAPGGGRHLARPAPGARAGRVAHN